MIAIEVEKMEVTLGFPRDLARIRYSLSKDPIVVIYGTDVTKFKYSIDLTEWKNEKNWDGNVVNNDPDDYKYSFI